MRKITSGGTSTIFAGALNGAGCSDGDRLTAMSFTSTRGVALDSSGSNLFVADTGCHSVRQISISTGISTTIAGPASAATVYCTANTDGPGASALFANPTGLAVDGAGNVFVSDADCNEIRKIAPDGTVSTLAGQWWSSGSANGIGTNAAFTVPTGLAFDGSGNLYVADSQNNLIRKIVIASGLVSTVAGQPPPAATGYLNGVGTNAKFKFPNSVAFRAGNLYVADSGAYLIRKIIVASAIVSHVAGIFNTYLPFTNGLGTAATFYDPQAIAVSPAGVLFVGDSGNNRIRNITGA